MEMIATIGGWGAALVLAVIALFPKKGALEHQMIDQQQERIQSLEERLDKLEPRLRWHSRRDIAWERREAQLMGGAERGEYPPWPEREGILMEEGP